MKLTVKYSNPGLSEVSHGVNELRYALYDEETATTIMPFVRCKDYIQDLFYSYYQKHSATVYGFSWTPDKHRNVLDKDNIFVAVSLAPRSNASQLLDITDKQYESVKALWTKVIEGLGYSVLICDKEETGKYILLSFDKKLTEVPYIVSALLLLIRLGFTYDPTKDVEEYFDQEKQFLSPGDAYQWKGSKDTLLELMCGKVDDEYTKWSNITSGYQAHGQTGVVYHSSVKRQKEQMEALKAKNTVNTQ